MYARVIVDMFGIHYLAAVKDRDYCTVIQIYMEHFKKVLL